MSKIIRNKHFYSGLLLLVALAAIFLVLPRFLPSTLAVNFSSLVSSSTDQAIGSSTVPVKVVKHLPTPEAVKGIYMTACVAGTPSFRAKLLALADETEINSIVIDIKDYTGTISFPTDDPAFAGNADVGCRVKDLADFIETLHEHGVYVIGRISSFQDTQMTKTHPDWAVKKNSDRSAVWKDRKGLSFVDAGAEPMWQYLSDLARASYALGFDEVNFDYIRFPSDGDMKDIYYPWSEKIWASTPASSTDRLIMMAASSTASTTAIAMPLSGKALVVRNFFRYLHEELGDTGLKISADLFGMTTTNYDDLNIGQVLEAAAVNFDYVAPMVYPSHYPVDFLNYKSVAEVNAHPYEIVKYSMDNAVRRLQAIGEDPRKLRPWLQDNDYPVPYTPDMVRAQIRAAYDAGLTSWMLWDAGNTYTQSALLP